MRSVTQLISVVLALCAFALALVAGLAAGNPADHIVGRAVVAMFIGQIVGALIGRAAQCVIDEHLERYRAEHAASESEQPDHTSSTEEPGAPAQTASSEGDERLAAA